MNSYIRAGLAIPFGYLKCVFTKLCHIKGFKGGALPRIDLFTEISMDKDAELKIGNRFNMRSNSVIRVRSGAKMTIGNNVSLNKGCIVTSLESITIGNDVIFSPYVSIYDHDHDFEGPDGIASGKYKTSPIIIGNNVWLGTNVVILRGSIIGDNSVIAAGSIVKGNVEPNSVLIQKRTNSVVSISGER